MARDRNEPVRLTKIYTRGGDSGETSLGDGSRASKLDLRIVAYGIVVLLMPLLWVVFWEGFPPLGLKAFSDSMGIDAKDRLAPGDVILWAIIAAALITLVFVPLELREKFQKRRHRLAPTTE